MLSPCHDRQPASSAWPICFSEATHYRDANASRDVCDTLSWAKPTGLGRKRVSVLLPIGAALLGLSAGGRIRGKYRAGVDRTASHVAADYRLVVLEGVTHWIPTQAPDALAEAIVARVAGDSTGPTGSTGSTDSTDSITSSYYLIPAGFKGLKTVG